MAIEIIPISNEDYIYGNFSRLVTLDEYSDTEGWYIFKLNKDMEYIMVYNYEKGSSDNDIVITFSSSFDKETWYDYGFYSRDQSTGQDTYVKVQLVLQDSVNSIYVISLPALVNYLKVNISGLVDGIFKFNIASVK